MSKMQSIKRDGLRKLVDVCMLILLLCLMSYQVTGEEKHEWTGILMLIPSSCHPSVLPERIKETILNARATCFSHR